MTKNVAHSVASPGKMLHEGTGMTSRAHRFARRNVCYCRAVRFLDGSPRRGRRGE